MRCYFPLGDRSELEYHLLVACPYESRNLSLKNKGTTRSSLQGTAHFRPYLVFAYVPRSRDVDLERSGGLPSDSPTSRTRCIYSQ